MTRHSTRHKDIDHGANAFDPRITRKGSKQLTDDKRASQVASQVEDPLIFKDPETLTEAKRKSQEFFNTPERIKGIQDAQAAREKMTEEEKEEEVENMRLRMGMLPKAIMLAMKKRCKPKGLYISIDYKEAALAKQADVPDPGDPIEIRNENDNDGRLQDHQ